MRLFFAIFALFFYCMTSFAALNKLVVFGDSLSDNGNLYEYMKQQLPLSPPYFQGRFTNGPVWVELLVQSYYPEHANEHLFDYAFGGAGVMEGDDVDEDLFTLRREMDSYFLAHQDKADANAMYIVWIGSNNYLAMPDNLDQTITEVTKGIQHGLQRLAEKGAKHILVVNLPDLGKIPAARDFDSVDMLTYLAKNHNEIISHTLEEYKKAYPDVQWLFFDVDQFFTDIMADPASFGITNLYGTCYEEMIASGETRSILKMVSTVRPKEKKDACDGYLFFDPVHPAKTAHEHMALRTKNLFDQSGVTFEPEKSS